MYEHLGLFLKGTPSLKTPPKEIVARGFVSIMGYLRRLKAGSTSCKRTKLMLVGLGGAGKTRYKLQIFYPVGKLMNDTIILSVKVVLTST